MTTKPPYIVHEVAEKAVTVDWFFGTGHHRLRQLVLVLIGWFFFVLPVYITLSALVNRNNPDRGWWTYHEGFVMWEVTMIFLGLLTVFFIVGFLTLYVINRSSARRRAAEITYDEERLAQRTEIADAWLHRKFGPEGHRLQQRRVRVEPYADIETYELRGLYREHEVD